MKITAKGVLHWHEGDFTIFRTAMSSCGPNYVPIREVECEFEIPDDFDPRPKQIEALRDHKQKILAETNVKVNNIEEQIQALLAIEHKPEMV